MSSCCVSFFFQAEDGIRDFHVTGVQTCALPIGGHGAVILGVGTASREGDVAGMGGHRLGALDHHNAEITVVVLEDRRQDGGHRLSGGGRRRVHVLEVVPHVRRPNVVPLYPGHVPRALLETDRLIMQRFSRRDAATLDEAIRASLPDLHQWLPWARMDYTSADTVAFL